MQPPLGAMGGPRLQSTSMDILPAPSITARLQSALAVVPGALGSISFTRSGMLKTLKKLFFITLAAAGLIVVGHAAWRGGLGHVVTSLVVSGAS